MIYLQDYLQEKPSNYRVVLLHEGGVRLKVKMRLVPWLPWPKVYRYVRAGTYADLKKFPGTARVEVNHWGKVGFCQTFLSKKEAIHCARLISERMSKYLKRKARRGKASRVEKIIDVRFP